MKMAFLYHGPLTLAIRELRLPLTAKHVNHNIGQCRPAKRPFGDLKFQGHSCNFFP